MLLPVELLKPAEPAPATAAIQPARARWKAVLATVIVAAIVITLLAAANREAVDSGGAQLDFGVGLHLGELLFGNIGIEVPLTEEEEKQYESDWNSVVT